MQVDYNRCYGSGYDSDHPHCFESCIYNGNCAKLCAYYPPPNAHYGVPFTNAPVPTSAPRYSPPPPPGVQRTAVTPYPQQVQVGVNRASVLPPPMPRTTPIKEGENPLQRMGKNLMLSMIEMGVAQIYLFIKDLDL